MDEVDVCVLRRVSDGWEHALVSRWWEALFAIRVLFVDHSLVATILSVNVCVLSTVARSRISHHSGVGNALRISNLLEVRNRNPKEARVEVVRLSVHETATTPTYVTCNHASALYNIGFHLSTIERVTSNHVVLLIFVSGRMDDARCSDAFLRTRIRYSGRCSCF